MLVVSSLPPPRGLTVAHTVVLLGIPPTERIPAIRQFAPASRSGGRMPACASAIAAPTNATPNVSGNNTARRMKDIGSPRHHAVLGMRLTKAMGSNFFMAPPISCGAHCSPHFEILMIFAVVAASAIFVRHVREDSLKPPHQELAEDSWTYRRRGARPAETRVSQQLTTL